MPGDGSCLFTSLDLAHSLVARVQRGEDAVIQQLLSIGVPQQHLRDIGFIGRHLRVRMVQEWQNDIDYYQGFVIEDLAQVSSSFLDNTQFSGSQCW